MFFTFEKRKTFSNMTHIQQTIKSQFYAQMFSNSFSRS